MVLKKLKTISNTIYFVIIISNVQVSRLFARFVLCHEKKKPFYRTAIHRRFDTLHQRAQEGESVFGFEVILFVTSLHGMKLPHL